MARMRVIGSSLDKGYRDDLNYNFGLLEALIGEANGLTDNLREEMLGKINNLQQQIDMLTGENIGELLERLNDSIQQALTAAQEARTAKTATEEATALATAATEIANASALLAEEKANYANEKAVLAQEAADNANQEASNLSQLKIDVVQATQNADTAAGNANQATQAAQTATNAINVVLPNVEGLVNLKEWNTETQYKKNNFVTLEGNGYMALRDNKGVRPPSSPVLSNADWAMFVQKGEKGEQGTGVRILGTLPDETSLPPIGEPGDAYLINGDLYVWSDTTNDWTNVGTIKGPKGDTGPQGPQGEQGPPGQDADLTGVNQEIANLQQNVTDNQQVVTEHLGQMVLTENGAHGIRYFNNELAIKDDQDQWVAVETGGSGEVYQENIIRTEKTNAFGLSTVARNTIFLDRVRTRNDTNKTITVDRASELKVNDVLNMHHILEGMVGPAEIIAISGNTLTLDTQIELTNQIQIVSIFRENTPTFSNFSNAFGLSSFATGLSSFSVGLRSLAQGDYSTAIGLDTTARMQSTSIGVSCEALGLTSVSIGSSSKALGSYSHAHGDNVTASGEYSRATGYLTSANGKHSNSQNAQTVADSFAGTAIGYHNKTMAGNPSSFVNTADAFVIGNGADLVLQGTNAFRVTFDGKVYGKAAYNSTGADYAEFFEWLDGNLNNEDRVGFVVTLDGDKIRKATEYDNYILGIISANPSVIGDSHQDEWFGMYLTDEWGRIQYHWVKVEYEETVPVTNELDGGGYIHTTETVIKTRQDYVPILNPDWNSTEAYIPREERKEWDAVGLMGKLLVRDDGTCKVNSYAKVGVEEGAVTASNERTDMRVIERVAPNIVRVFIK
ncbi:hypothetical protein HXV90_03080 [Lysinibacillus sp. JK80]|uniref:peptidase G2 autoproteolytic cleavage domain-containing protein n=1 Tax=Lysinibacillus sp. JK80 TaxID=2749809 RepID=UPI0022B979C3|nr:peptidase G2 autoproteolytic cleavage domain-containing protein [Lysinibacillus sp. JK80]WBF54908.1 hypothetical protein HXV90_03080 [Lysinibacillus sp. JK80]